VNAKITALRGVKDGADSEAIKKATEELSNEMSKIGEAINKASTANPSPDSSGQATGADSAEQPRDADFKEKKEGNEEEPKE
jgi:hypothetical protein